MILADTFLEEGYAMAGEFGLSVPDRAERSHITGKVLSAMCDHQNAVRLAAACEAYYVYRKLHARRGEGVEAATLLGDYFFSAFSRLMLPFQDTWLLDRFSEQLRINCVDSVKRGREIDIEDYLAFVGMVCRHLNSVR